MEKPPATRERIQSLTVLLVIGVGLLGFAFWHLHQLRGCRTWPTVPATVTALSITTTTNLSHHGVLRRESADFTYRYVVNGTGYFSHRFSLIPAWPPARSLRRDFPVGTQFTARYRPDKPQISVVEPGRPHYPAFAGAGIFLGLYGAGLFYHRSAATSRG